MGKITTRGTGEVHATPTIAVATFAIARTGDDAATVRAGIDDLLADLFADYDALREAGRVVRWVAPPYSVGHEWGDVTSGIVTHYARTEHVVRFADKTAVLELVARYPNRGLTLTKTVWELEDNARHEAAAKARACAVADAQERARDYALAAGAPEPTLESIVEIDIAPEHDDDASTLCIRSVIEATFTA